MLFLSIIPTFFATQTRDEGSYSIDEDKLDRLDQRLSTKWTTFEGCLSKKEPSLIKEFSGIIEKILESFQDHIAKNNINVDNNIAKNNINVDSNLPIDRFCSKYYRWLSNYFLENHYESLKILEDFSIFDLIEFEGEVTYKEALELCKAGRFTKKSQIERFFNQRKEAFITVLHHYSNCVYNSRLN